MLNRLIEPSENNNPIHASIRIIEQMMSLVQSLGIEDHLLLNFNDIKQINDKIIKK